MVRQSADELQHPRRNLGNRFRSQAEKFVKLAKRDPDREQVNLAWAEQNAQQALLHDFTEEKNWLTLVHIKVLRADSDGIHRSIEDLFIVLGRDPERLSSLQGIDFLSMGHDLMSASLIEDPLDPDEWWQQISENDGIEEFLSRCKRLDFKDQRANIIFGRRLQRLREHGRVDLFIELVQHLLAHRPANHELWLESGRLHEQRGEVDEAWLCYDHVQALQPNSEERDRFLSRLTAKMDGQAGWKGPDRDARSSFQKRMEILASKVSSASIEVVSEEDESTEEVDRNLIQLEALLEAGDGEQAFFLARRLLVNGENWAQEYLDRASALLK